MINREDPLQQVLICKLIPKFGVTTLKTILQHYSLTQFISMQPKQLQTLALTPSQIHAITTPNQQLIQQLMAWQQPPNQQIISYFDENYPSQLKEIASPPLILFTKGNSALLHTPQIAIVGSRNFSITGQDNAYQFGYTLAQLEITITSGLALGIDSFSHKGALSAKGNTIGVLGTGIDYIYPKRNLALAKQISQQGLLVSEFLPNQTVRPEHFPQRNRIIAGLSLGTLVIEAALKSGSLITARYALEQNREVFAIPGSLANPLCCGCHQLIKQGAKLVETIHDIIAELPQLQEYLIAQKHQLEPPKAHNSIDPDQLNRYPLLAYIDYDVTSINKIVQQSQLSVNDLLPQLLEMELSGIITAVSGGYLKK